MVINMQHLSYVIIQILINIRITYMVINVSIAMQSNFIYPNINQYSLQDISIISISYPITNLYTYTFRGYQYTIFVLHDFSDTNKYLISDPVLIVQLRS